METLLSSETPVLTTATRRNIPKNGVLHSHRLENLKSCAVLDLICNVLKAFEPRTSGILVYGTPEPTIWILNWYISDNFLVISDNFLKYIIDFSSYRKAAYVCVCVCVCVFLKVVITFLNHVLLRWIWDVKRLGNLSKWFKFLTKILFGLTAHCDGASSPSTARQEQRQRAMTLHSALSRPARRVTAVQYLLIIR
jgi:hypothetical protein